MRIAVMAAGAVGGYFGARLAQAGHEVAFVARGRQLEALRARGLRVQSPLGDVHLPDVQVTDDPAEIGAVDLVLFGVKLWDTLEAAEASKYDGSLSPRVRQFRDACADSGIDAEVSDHIEQAIWEKFVFLVGLFPGSAAMWSSAAPVWACRRRATGRSSTSCPSTAKGAR